MLRGLSFSSEGVPNLLKVGVNKIATPPISGTDTPYSFIAGANYFQLLVLNLKNGSFLTCVY